MATAVSVGGTGNPEIDGLLGGSRWTGTITYSFPDSPSDYPVNYYGNGEPTTSGFASVPVAIQQAITYTFALIANYTNATIQFAGTGGADIAIARSPAANPTAYAYYPYNVPAGGDLWFGTAYDYSQARLGNYYFVTALHELGHALGLKHSQELGGVSNVAVPAAHDNSEYTVMSYRSYAGAPLTGYTAEAFGYPQTYMANDILALQTLYGADYTTHSENTVYTWSSTTGQQFINGVAQLAPGTGNGGSSNRIFETVWDGNGIDTYDFSNYATALTVNLNPGAASITSAAQIAYLGNGHYATGNIYNAYLFNGDARSYIDNALGGSGNDSITGNAIANNLNGGGGNDTLIGGGGNDIIVGGTGTDRVVFTGNRASYLISYNAGTQTFTVADQRGGSPDGADTITGVENFQFLDGVFASSTFETVNRAPLLTMSPNVTVNSGVVLTASSLFSATDADGDVLTYYLYDNSSAPSSGRFVVNGVAVPANAAYAVSEEQLAQTVFVVGAAGTSDDLRVQISDSQITTSWGQINVNVANRAPTDEALFGGVISENSANGIVVGAVTGIDPDSGTVFRYSLIDDADGRFAIDASTGQLTVTDGAHLDYEVASSHLIVVRAVDQAGLSIDKMFTIQLADVPGVILNGDEGNNTLVGTPEADVINSFAGNDILTGGGGNDTIDDGGGIDTVVYSGNRADYQMGYNSTVQTFTIADRRQGSPDGTDEVTHVEQFQFADGSSIYSFDDAGGLISETFNSSNGSALFNAFDTAGDQAWVWSISKYDPNGALMSQSGLKDDGTHWLTLYDLNNQYGWANATINFDSDWNVTSVTGSRDDGSLSVTMSDVASAYDTGAWNASPLISLNSAAGNDNFALAPILEQNTFIQFAEGNFPGRIDLHAFDLIPFFGLRGATASNEAEGNSGIRFDTTEGPLALFGLHAGGHQIEHFLF